jgi:ParB family chromosome partitioning protein
LRLLKLPAPVQRLVHDGKLTAGHARALIGRSDAELLAAKIVEHDLNVREVEALVHEADREGEDSGSPRKAKEKDPDTRAFEKDLANALGLKVEIKRGSGESGVLTIKYGNFDQLEYLRMRLIGQGGS